MNIKTEIENRTTARDDEVVFLLQPKKIEDSSFVNKIEEKKEDMKERGYKEEEIYVLQKVEYSFSDEELIKRENIYVCNQHEQQYIYMMSKGASHYEKERATAKQNEVYEKIVKIEELQQEKRNLEAENRRLKVLLEEEQKE